MIYKCYTHHDTQLSRRYSFCESPKFKKCVLWWSLSKSSQVKYVRDFLTVFKCLDQLICWLLPLLVIAQQMRLIEQSPFLRGQIFRLVTKGYYIR